MVDINLGDFGMVLFGTALLLAVGYGTGFVTGYQAGLDGPIVNLELENSTVTFCQSSNYYPPKTNESYQSPCEVIE